MKTIQKNTQLFFATFLVACFCLAISNLASAQKPAGKPWPAPEASAKMKSPLKSADMDAGKEIYNQQCKSCHGAKGKGDGTKAEKLDITCGDFTTADFAKEPEGTLYWKTTEGRKPMPSFKEKLSDQERWQVVAFIRSLGGK
jgi:mono/diheme cytochrome c family protein